MKLPVVTALASFIALVFLVDVMQAASIAEEQDPSEEEQAQLENLLLDAGKRANCIRRSASCDGRPDDCCPDTACRCNLFGSNCKCERQGLLQKWGKRSNCIRRAANCDGRPNDCCAETACRCNLFGTNCKCERQGLLQRWGRK